MVNTHRIAHAEATDGDVDTPLSHDDTSRSDKDENEVEEMLGNFSPSNGIAADTALTGDSDEAHATVQYSDLEGNGGLRASSQVERDSISAGPSQNTTIPQTSVAGCLDSGREKAEVESHSSVHPQATAYTIEEVEAEKLPTHHEQSAEARVHSEPPNSAPSPAVAENEAVEHDMEMLIDDERPARSLTRAAARAVERAEETREAGDATRKNQGKEKAKDLPSTDEAATGSKRSRDEDEGAGDASPAEMEPDPECSPTHRTRQRMDQHVEEEARAPTQPQEPKRRLHPWDVAMYDPATIRGIKRHRSLGPEPSERVPEPVQKRARSAGPPRRPEPVHFTWNAVASSSRVTLDQSEAGPREGINAFSVTLRLEEQEIETLLDSPVPFQPVPSPPSPPTSTPTSALPFPLNPSNPPDLVLQPPPTFAIPLPNTLHQTPTLRHPNLPVFNRFRTPPPPSPHREHPFPPYLSPPGHDLRRHDTCFIGRHVYRP